MAVFPLDFFTSIYTHCISGVHSKRSASAQIVVAVAFATDRLLGGGWKPKASHDWRLFQSRALGANAPCLCYFLLFHSMTETLIIFSRYPEAGKTKTRMIPALGAVGAADLQRAMTEHTLQTAIALASNRQTAIEIQFAGGDIQLMRSWLGQDLQYKPQVLGDLGVKMRSAFEGAFAAGKQRVVIICIDCPDLDRQILAQAFDSLFHNDLVLGVAEDGGYYLIGLNSLQPLLLKDITWGTELVLKQTKAIAQQLNLKVDYLTTLADVDRPEDLEIWQKHANN